MANEVENELGQEKAKEYFLVYTLGEGSYFKTLMSENGQVRRFTKDEYETVKATGLLTWNEEPWADTPRMVTVEPVFIALCAIEDDYDFILGSSRETAKSPAGAGRDK